MLLKNISLTNLQFKKDNLIYGMFRYKAVLKDLYLSKTRFKNVSASNSLEAHKLALSNVNLSKEDIVKILDQDGNIVYNINKGFIHKY